MLLVKNNRAFFSTSKELCVVTFYQSHGPDSVPFSARSIKPGPREKSTVHRLVPLSTSSGEEESASASVHEASEPLVISLIIQLPRCAKTSARDHLQCAEARSTDFGEYEGGSRDRSLEAFYSSIEMGWGGPRVGVAPHGRMVRLVSGLGSTLDGRKDFRVA
jgi:hypothetical protein